VYRFAECVVRVNQVVYPNVNYVESWHVKSYEARGKNICGIKCINGLHVSETPHRYAYFKSLVNSMVYLKVVFLMSHEPPKESLSLHSVRVCEIWWGKRVVGACIGTFMGSSLKNKNIIIINKNKIIQFWTRI